VSTTYLLTDIEGSTRLWEQDPTAMLAIIARHDELIESVVTSNRGALDPDRSEGDSAFATFADPADAVRAALVLQVAMAQEAWPGSHRVKIRIALYTSAARTTVRFHR
jgi:class 3 adenylate cyclase